MELHDACACNQLDTVKKLLSCRTGLEVINSQPVEIVLWGTRDAYREEQFQTRTICVPEFEWTDYYNNYKNKKH